MAVKDQWATQLREIIEGSEHKISDILPADWAEANVNITKGKFQGLLSYDRTPYSREIINCLSPYHYSNEIVLMGGAQWGKTVSVIQPAIAYYISQHPCDMGYLTGHSDLSDEAMAKLDSAIDDSGIRPLIRPTTLRKRNSRTGDTNKMKEFPYGSLVSGSATNHKLLRQRTWKVVFPDDIEAAKGASKESGSTVALIRARTKSFGNSKKIFWCSTPELKQGSIIEELFLSGDQRRYHIPCPHCSTAIVLKWKVQVDDRNTAGFTWRTENGRLVPGSVEYICQSCGKGFDDRNKYEMNLAGMWIPTAIPDNPTTVSFHLPSLYATAGMDGWEEAVREYLAANPGGGKPRDEKLMQTFVNLTLGETYEPLAETTTASNIIKNMRSYEIATVPERLSLQHGNGKIVLLTCSADLNGKMKGYNSEVNDARLDYEIVGHCENGSIYSIVHGSIGTFKPGRASDDKEDRIIWTYEHNAPNSVWPVFEKILEQTFMTDGPVPRKMPIGITCLDCGAYSAAGAYPFLEKTNCNVVGVKGAAEDEEDKFISTDKDAKIYKLSQARTDMYILQVSAIKDTVNKYMNLRWDEAEAQPPNFMNYPHTGKYVCPVKKAHFEKKAEVEKRLFPYDGDYLYTVPDFFSHYEAEHRTTKTDGAGNIKYRWVKKNSAAQNHFFDCRVYQHAAREILLAQFAKMWNVKDLTWAEFVMAAIKQIR